MLDDMDSVGLDNFDAEEDEEELMMSQGAYAHQALMRKPEKAKWTVSEDSVLQQAVTMHDGKNWKSIASYLEGKTEVQVCGCFSPRGRIPHVLCYTLDKMTQVYVLTPPLSPPLLQCLHRWTKVLNPNLTKGPWTDDEGEFSARRDVCAATGECRMQNAGIFIWM